ncbi:MAG: penicillin-binding protein 2 [Holosporaceae bacterium]|jgi:penicillin-binding protein 2|nr:penicillin-binding protein 2 [Holosporaceae bacterium]
MLNGNDPRRGYQLRSKIVLATCLAFSAILVYRLYVLQILESPKYLLMSHKNRIRLSTILPKRGRIISANNVTIAGNHGKYRLLMEACNKENFINNLNLLGKYLNLTTEEKATFEKIRGSVPKYTTITIRDDLSWDEYVKISMIFFKLNHVVLENTFTREYAFPQEFSHVLGYIGKNSDNIFMISGKTGLELSLNRQLAGKFGTAQIEINAVGKKMRLLSVSNPVNGRDIAITIDTRLQRYIFDLISHEKAGACVVVDVADGSILAMVSVPAFDANCISSKISQKQWNNLIDDPFAPLMNRVINCVYPPGSIFKIVVAMAALCEGVVSDQERISCSGCIDVNHHKFHCWNRYGHGAINLTEAIAMSCDCYFFEIAQRLGIDNIIKYAKKFGFGAKTGIELFYENCGLLPTREWKFLRHSRPWTRSETIITAIGQGALLSNLLQTAMMFCKLYVNDYALTSTLIKKSGSVPENASILRNEIFGDGCTEHQTPDPINEKYAKIIKNALYQVCNAPYGTAFLSCKADYGISGKTGSSQVRRLKDHEVGMHNKNIPWEFRDHAFFVGCAPQPNPRYVVAVLVEHGGGGASVAAPIARRIFDKLLELFPAGTKK